MPFCPIDSTFQKLPFTSNTLSDPPYRAQDWILKYVPVMIKKQHDLKCYLKTQIQVLFRNFSDLLTKFSKILSTK